MGKKTFVTIILAAMCAIPACAGPDLDRILNYMFMDQSVPMKGAQLLFDVRREIQVTRDTRIGQTFMTGSSTGIIARIRAYLVPTADWQKGEGAELTLWDSPERNKKLASFTVWYENRNFHYKQMEWDLNVDATPNTSYYFEITYAGDGDGKLGRVGVMDGTDAYKLGQGYLNGIESDFDICFQVHSRRPPDRIGNLKKMFSRLNLDMPGLAEVKQAVEKGDFETAIAKTVAYFEGRKKPFAIIDERQAPKRDPNYDLSEADSLMGATWRQVDMEGYGGRKIFINAYNASGDEKYAKKLNDLLIEWYINSPPPSESRIGGCPWDPMWSSLSTGLRLGHGFVAYSWLHRSPSFSTDCRMAYIISLADHCNTLVQYGADAGGNWSFTQNSAMLTFAMNFPEFKESEIWKKTAIERLTATIKRDILPDGVETESAPSYQRMAYNPLANGVYDDLVLRRQLQTPFARELRDILEKQAEYFMYIAMPDGTTPYLGDWAHENQRAAILADARRFGRSDMLYVGSGGKQGTVPKELSKLYPYAGIVTMRSDWGGDGRSFEDARYLILHGVHYGAHGHEDINGISALYAYGRELLTDPGAHLYGSPEHHLLTTSVSHNLMTVDGEQQDRGSKTAFENWSTTPIADYLSSWADCYKSGDYTREVFYVRSNGDPGALDYWVIRDIAGKKKREEDPQKTHSLEQRWRFLFGTPVTTDPDNLTVKTEHESGGNLAIMQVTPSRLQLEKTTTDTWLWRGQDTNPSKLPTFIYKVSTKLPAAIDTILFPFKGRQMPEVRTRTLEMSDDGLSSAFEMVQGRVSDLFVFQRSCGPKTINEERISFDGERLFIRRVRGRLRSAVLINGRSLVIDGREIMRSDERVSWVTVCFGEGGTTAYVSSRVPGLIIRGQDGWKVDPKVMNTDNLVRIHSFRR